MGMTSILYCSATVAVTCEKDVGMGLCMLRSCYPYPCFLAFWHSIPTSFLIFLKFFHFLVYTELPHIISKLGQDMPSSYLTEINEPTFFLFSALNPLLEKVLIVGV